MKNNLSKKSNKPIENHKTAAWADVESVEPDSRVPIPSEEAVINAKEWVDSNEK